MTDPTPKPTETPKGASVGLVAGGAAGVLAVIAAVGDLLAQHGQLLSTLANFLGNVPLLLLLGYLGYRAALAWRKAETDRAAEAAAASAATRDVADGVAGLRGELHQLRSDLRTHADVTETRLRAVEAEVSTVSGRVAALEGRPKRAPAKRR